MEKQARQKAVFRAAGCRPYGVALGWIEIVGAFCERPRANAVRPYGVTIGWIELVGDGATTSRIAAGDENSEKFVIFHNPPHLLLCIVTKVKKGEN